MAGPKPLRVLAIIARLKWLHIDYLHALARGFELTVACGGERHPGAVARARREGLRVVSLPAEHRGQDASLAELISAASPQVVHVFYDQHESLTVLAREHAPDALLIYECRDPLTTLARASGSATEKVLLERGALEASDGQLFVSGALRGYLERLHKLELGATSILVPHGFALCTMAVPTEKLSARDGQTHLALVGTASDVPGHSRYYIDTIQRLTGMGFTVHSHFFEPKRRAGKAYRALARRNRRYHHHPTVSLRGSTRLSQVISRYDLMGVFYDLAAHEHNETPVLAVCMPTKAASGWFHGGIPVVCSRHYGGLVELIDEYGIGFTFEDEAELAELVGQRAAIADATERTMALRARFSNEWNARRIDSFVRVLLGRQTVMEHAR